MSVTATLKGIQERSSLHGLSRTAGIIRISVNQRRLVLEIAVFVVNRLAPLVALSCVAILDNLVIGQNVLLSQGLIKALDVICECAFNELPKQGVRSIVSVQVADNIVYLDVVAESDCTLVVDAEDGIVIIENEKPLAASVICQELVLRSLVNHSENQCNEVIEENCLLVEILFQFCFELVNVTLARNYPCKHFLHL